MLPLCTQRRSKVPGARSLEKAAKLPSTGRQADAAHRGSTATATRSSYGATASSRGKRELGGCGRATGRAELGGCGTEQRDRSSAEVRSIARTPTLTNQPPAQRSLADALKLSSAGACLAGDIASDACYLSWIPGPVDK
jgi:hypothetical protein